jgi:hypothetical protein
MSLTPALNSSFFDPKLLQTAHFRTMRECYEQYFEEGLVSKYRWFPIVIEKLQNIFDYNEQHAKYFARRIKTQDGDPRSCEAVISEAIVYAHYIPLVRNGLVKSLERCEDNYDLRIERNAGPDVFLEIFCIMPELKPNAQFVYSIATHTQTASASVRQKLLSKLEKQKQMRETRENWAVVELNDLGIAGDFAVASSLSSGYKINIDASSGKVIGSGYDWQNSVFDLPQTENLHGVIYFSLGHYEGRRYIVNQRVHGEMVETTPRVP